MKSPAVESAVVVVCLQANLIPARCADGDFYVRKT